MGNIYTSGRLPRYLYLYPYSIISVNAYYRSLSLYIYALPEKRPVAASTHIRQHRKGHRHNKHTPAPAPAATATPTAGGRAGAGMGGLGLGVCSNQEAYWGVQGSAHSLCVCVCVLYVNGM